jgi:hypothetical protein
MEKKELRPLFSASTPEEEKELRPLFFSVTERKEPL